MQNTKYNSLCDSPREKNSYTLIQDRKFLEAYIQAKKESPINLGWAIYKLIQNIASRTRIQELIAEFKEIDFSQEDDTKVEQLKKAFQYIISSPFESLCKKSKTAEHYQAYKDACKLIDSGIKPDDKFAWIVYYHLKALKEARETAEFKYLLAHEIKQQHIKVPSLAYSMLANLAFKEAYERPDSLNFGKFIKFWGIKNFDKSDLESNTSYKPRIYSYCQQLIIEKVDICYIKEICEGVSYCADKYAIKVNISEIFQHQFYNEIFYCKDNKLKQRQLLNYYSQNYCDPMLFSNSIYHVKILNSAHFLLEKNYEEELLNFFISWKNLGLDFIHLSDEDNPWQQRNTGEQTFPSLLATVLKVVSDYAYKNQNISSSVINGLIQCLKEAEGHPAKDNNIWLRRNHARLLARVGRHNEALTLLRSLVTEKNEWYIWNDLANTVSTIDTDLQLAFLIKALNLPAEPEMTVKVRWTLIRLLIQKNMYSFAKVEFSSIANFYIDRIPYEYAAIISALEYVNPEESKYRDVVGIMVQRAESFVWNIYPEFEAVYIDKYKNKDGKERFKFLRLDTKEIFSLSSSRSLLLKDKPLGACVLMRGRTTSEGKVLVGPMVESAAPPWKGSKLEYGFLQNKREDGDFVWITLPRGSLSFKDTGEYQHEDGLKIRFFEIKRKGKVCNYTISIEKVSQKEALDSFNFVKTTMYNFDRTFIYFQIDGYVARIPFEHICHELGHVFEGKQESVVHYSTYENSQGEKKIKIIAIDNILLPF